MASKKMCRCCLLRPPDKNLKSVYQRLGQKEVYADMLKECFEIHLLLNTSEEDSGICEVCITRLRDAYDFKHQVLDCQKQLQKVLGSCIKGEKFPKVKEEASDFDMADVIYLDEELKAELPDFDDGFQDEDDTKLADLLGLSQLTIKKRSDKKKKRASKKDGDRKNTKGMRLSIRALAKLENFGTNIFHDKKTEGAKHKNNIDNLLKYSNCTPFSNKTIAGIVCAFCKHTLKNLEELRTHRETTHKNEELNLKPRDKNNLSIKMDITDLKCNVCEEKFNVITSLKKHLAKEHDVKFYPDVNDYIMEFKLNDDGEIMNCALCNSTYETFKMLLQHMNGHYRNYICNQCDLGFINKHRLKNHQRTHETGTFKCSFCDKVFTTKVRKMCHEKYTHSDSARYSTNCPQCNQSFTSYYQRNRHMYTEHHMVAATYKCNICDKSFILKSKLTAHIKKVHLMERNHICPQCGQGFFIKQSLEEHMIKHNGERIYKCTVCLKAYARKKTLREHMRIHNNDRRFKCGICGLSFVQKCSLKSHMLSNHGITLAEYESARIGANGRPGLSPVNNLVDISKEIAVVTN